MAKIFLVSLLLMLVYSWEEFKYCAKFFLRLLIYSDTRPFGTERHKASITIDRFVSVSIGLAAIPIGLAFFLGENAFSIKNLITLAGSLLGIALVAYFSGFVAKRLARLPYYDQLGPSAFAALYAGSLFSPTLRLFTDFDRMERVALAKFAAYLSLPPLVGLGMKFLLGQSYVDERFMPSLDNLIQVLIGALFVQLTLTFLEKHFRSNRFARPSHLFRVLLGVLLATVMIFSGN